jgi:3-dehydroquinate dehydratase-2
VKILVINGPNLNMLGIREPEIYGRQTLKELEALIAAHAAGLGIEADFYQSNHEGCIVDRIQAAYGAYEGLIINPGAYTHTSIAIPDAIKAVGLPAVEVHISDISAREEYRRVSYTSCACVKTIAGKGFGGYLEAVDVLAELLGGR